MDNFVSNTIFNNREFIAQELKQKRYDKKINLTLASQKTNINQKYLIALESGDWRALPAGVYGKNFLKEYALFLGADVKMLQKLYEEEIGKIEEKKHLQIFTKITPRFDYIFNLPKIIKALIIFLVVAVCLIYLGFYVNQIIAAPDLEIDQPANNLVIADNIATISGKTESNTEVKINGAIVMVKDDGSFTSTINLKKGTNIIIIDAKKKYSKTKEIIRQIFVQ
jgi:cytoskeletal protein RodZ